MSCYIKNFINILDKIALSFIIFFSIMYLFQIVGFNIFELDLNNYDADLKIAQKYQEYIWLFLAILGIVFWKKQRYPFLQKIEMLVWCVFILLTPYFMHNIPSIEQAYSNISFFRTDTNE